jgi:hypothetical protein
MPGGSIFEWLSNVELREIFDWNGEKTTVKPRFRAGITRHFGDGADAELFTISAPPPFTGLHGKVLTEHQSLRRRRRPSLHSRCRSRVSIKGSNLCRNLIREVHDGDPTCDGTRYESGGPGAIQCQEGRLSVTVCCGRPHRCLDRRQVRSTTRGGD